jgi:DHA2 family multidrug resistance protein
VASAARPAGKAPQGLADTHPDEQPHLQTGNRGLLIAGVMLASVLQLIDATIANVAIPYMRTSLSAAPDTITWVLTSYIIASAVFLPITGWMADRFGSRRLLIGSVICFILASVLCGTAQSLSEMVTYRAIQGVAGAFILPLGQAAMLDITPRSRHAQMMGIWGAGVVLGPIVGPVLGGYLTEYWNWRWVFFVNLPIGAVALAILLAELPSRPIRRRRFDVFGFALIGITLASLQLLLDRGPHVDWFTSVESWIYLLVSISCAWMGVIQLATGKNPLFERAIFQDRNMVVAMLFLLVVGFAMFASMALLPPMLQGLMGYDAIDTGIMLMARGIGVIVSMQFAALLVKRGVDTRAVVAIGFLGTAFSFHMMSSWSLSVGAPEIFWSGIVQGLGIGLVFIPLNTLAFATLPPHFRTDASSLTNLARTVGSSVGIAIMAYLLARNTQISHSDLTGAINQPASSLIDLSTVDRYQELGDAALRMLDLEINRQAAMVAYIDDFYLMMWLTLAIIPLVLFMRKPPPMIRR